MVKMKDLYAYTFIAAILLLLPLHGEDAAPIVKQPMDAPSTLETSTIDPVEFDDIYLDPNSVHVILEPLHRATLSSQITSPIVSIEKHMGDSFKPGDVLIKLDDIIYRSSLKKALATYKQAELALKTREELFEGDVGSLVELREAQTQFATAQADLSIARKQLEAATITAPYHGRIVDVYVHDYELAEALEPLIDIIGDDILLARMIIESSQLNRINIGTQIEIYFPEADLKVPAIITRIGAEIDPASSTIRVDAELENREYRLTSGMSGMTLLPQPRSVVKVPAKPEAEPEHSSLEEPAPNEQEHQKVIALQDFINELDEYDLSKEDSHEGCDPTGCKIKRPIESEDSSSEFDFEEAKPENDEAQTAFQAFLEELDQYDLSKFDLYQQESK